jgi:hypothetical protein
MQVHFGFPPIKIVIPLFTIVSYTFQSKIKAGFLFRRNPALNFVGNTAPFLLRNLLLDLQLLPGWLFTADKRIICIN